MNSRQTSANVADVPTALEVAVKGLWRNVLERDDVGLDDDFLMLGGDSLRALALLGAVESVFAVDLTVRDVFEAGATVRTMAAMLTAARAEPPRRDAAPLEPLGDEAGRRLSLAQESEWVMSAFAADMPVG